MGGQLATRIHRASVSFSNRPICSAFRSARHLASDGDVIAGDLKSNAGNSSSSRSRNTTQHENVGEWPPSNILLLRQERSRDTGGSSTDDVAACYDQNPTTFRNRATNKSISCTELFDGGYCDDDDFGEKVQEECPMSCDACTSDDYSGGGTDGNHADNHNTFARKDPASKELEIHVKEWLDYEQEMRAKYGDIKDWDVSAVTDMSNLFWNDAFKDFNADLSGWNVSRVTTMESMFQSANAFNCDLNNWDVGNVKNMESMFADALSFNSDLNRWDVSKVENMDYMFWGAQVFNSDLSSWNVGNVKSMASLFTFALPFTSDLSMWNVSKVETMCSMFENVGSFNSDLSRWNVSNVKDMSMMFNAATSFNADLSRWDVGNVVDMSKLFYGALMFKSGDLSGWKISNVNDTSQMFSAAVSFESNLKNWDVSNVENMLGMFRDTNSFNSNLNGWKVSKVTDMHEMFANTRRFNSDLSSWNVSRVTDMHSMFANANSFNSDLSGWDVGNVGSMDSMFSSAPAFNQDLGTWHFNPGQAVTLNTMFANTAKSQCKVETPATFGAGRNSRKSVVNRIYCNQTKLKDGALCSSSIDAESQCDTGICGSTRCCSYNSILVQTRSINHNERACTTCTSTGGCFHPPTLSPEFKIALSDIEQGDNTKEDEQKIFPAKLEVGKIFKIKWSNGINHLLKKDGNGTLVSTEAEYSLRWIRQSYTGDSNAPFQVGEHPPLDVDNKIWEPDGLDSGPGGVEIFSTTGTIYATPKNNGTYTAWLVAMNAQCGQAIEGIPAAFDQVLIKKWIMTVKTKTKFTINPVYVSRNEDARPGVRPASYQKPEAGTLYTVGETYSYAPIRIGADGISGNKPDSENNWKITYTLVDQPDGLLVDPADGFIQGVPTKEGPFTMKVYAIDGSGQRSAYPIEIFTFDVRNGPHNKSCSNGGFLVAPDKSHSLYYCNCEGTGYEGANCDTSEAVRIAIEGGVSVASVLLLASIVYMYRARHLRLEAQVAALARARKAYGLVSGKPNGRGVSVNSGDLVGVTTNPSFVGLDAARELDVVLLLDHEVGYSNDLLTYEDDEDDNGENSARANTDKHASLSQSPTTLRNQLSKFVAPTISLGKSTLAAKGLDVLLGVDPKTYMHVKNKVKVMLKEFAANGTDEDNKNLKALLDGTYKHPPNSDGSPLTAEDIRGQSITMDELMASSNVQDAGLERHHVLALRLYTTSTFRSINNPMRQTPPVLPHPFAATMFYISDALSKLRELQGKDLAMRNETLVFWRGMKDLQITDEFILTGGSEMACMSTTSEQKVAVEFALSKSPLLFKFVSKSFMSHGADISFLSVYPGEAEVLFPPLTYLRPIKLSQEIINGKTYQVVEVEPVFPK